MSVSLQEIPDLGHGSTWMFASKEFPLSTVDLSSDTARQTLVAAGTPTRYQGHPTTLLLPDGKTVYCVWTYGHGGACGPLKRSDDGGRTWGELLTVPDNWKEVRNCPVIFRLPDPSGHCRLFIYAGQGPDGCIHESHSDDEGRTWSPMRSIGMTAVMPFCTIVPVDGGRRLLALSNIRREGEMKDAKSNVVAQSFSNDGGFSWRPWRVIADNPDLKFCEPWVVPSPDGAELTCLMRENANGISWFTTTKDEGVTWMPPKPLPVGLAGDRHIARFAPDGRLVVAFRDRAANSGTTSHFVAWVGRYEDLFLNSGDDGSSGNYRIKILHSHAGGDCAYPGLEVLPDGTFVATTYIKYRPGADKHSIVSAHFTLAETDQLIAP